MRASVERQQIVPCEWVVQNGVLASDDALVWGTEDERRNDAKLEALLRGPRCAERRRWEGREGS